MAEEIFDKPDLRVVRSDEQHGYLVQIGLDGVYRTMATFKLGKFDQLRAQAQQEKASGKSSGKS